MRPEEASALDVPAYRRMARVAGKVWREHGALDGRECVGDDLAPRVPDLRAPPPFPTMVKVKRGETVVFAWIVFRSRAHRDRVNKKAMTDPRILRRMKAKPRFEDKRMPYGGSKTIV